MPTGSCIGGYKYEPSHELSNEASSEAQSSCSEHQYRDFEDDTSNTTLGQLNSGSKEELLEAIDKLRNENIDAEVSIPQIVVCGDQSSGKSSVLEAIADVSFPIGINTVTRFATEIILRRAQDECVSVSLRPGPSRGLDAQERIKAFKPNFEVTGARHVKEVIKAALDHLTDFEPHGSVWSDVLRIELSGPTKEHLTLVDVPGLIQANVGTRKGDKAKILELVKSYLEKPRSIVLAVVSAQYDLGVQQVIELVRSDEAVRRRTLGVITKPDCLRSGSDAEKEAIQLAEGHRVRMAHGWHVLRNQSHEEEDRSATKRREMELDFFTHGNWSRVKKSNVGAERLAHKLNELLFGCIATELPTLLEELELKAQESACRGLSYGDYDKSEFKDYFDDDRSKRLRTLVNGNTDQFAARLRTNGCQYRFVSSGAELVRGQGVSKSPTFFPPYLEKGMRALDTVSIEVGAYCQATAAHLDDLQGPYLSGLFPAKLITSIFRQLSTPWKTNAQQYVKDCHTAMRTSLEAAVMHVADRVTGRRLMNILLSPEMDDRWSMLNKKLTEIMWPLTSAHPMTWSRVYTQKVAEDKRDTMTALGAMDPPSRKSSTHNADILQHYLQAHGSGLPQKERAAAEAIEKADAYYQVALDTFVDNCALLVVEACLLNNLNNVFEPEQAWNMDPVRLAEVAAEPEEARAERIQARAQRVALESVISTCKKYERPLEVINLSSLSIDDTPTRRELSQPSIVFGGNQGQSVFNTAPTNSQNSNHVTTGGIFGPATAFSASNGLFGQPRAVQATGGGFGGSATATNGTNPFPSFEYKPTINPPNPGPTDSKSTTPLPP
ncbi:hypothetical protein LTR78_004468 [Recurvomyces mirabilis]|uniref:Uncharacterized protein n=1 Tax=Recurvomyces mirabilis TaxID=574656 RepID=A0AAE0WPY9_9PEZI|nr:hypothetical protein LTR78_004468 [Recurvomyces mirabilis]KAK5155866.1 hypothetical protein LTS14_005432 [Recurvomyces mirabilis]